MWARGRSCTAASFRNDTCKDSTVPLRSEGHFTLAPGHGLIWRMEKPFARDDGDHARRFDPGKQWRRNHAPSSARLPFLSHLYDMLGGALAGDWHALDNDFAVTASGNDTHWQVVLKPRVAPDPIGMPFQAITVAGGRYADSVVLEKVGGDTDTLTFFDQDLATAPPVRR